MKKNRQIFGILVLLLVGISVFPSEKSTSQMIHQQADVKPILLGKKEEFLARIAKKLAELEYSGEKVKIINENHPYFDEKELKRRFPLKKFTPLDALGRVGCAEARLGRESLPTKKRQLLKTKPTGWKKIFIDGVMLYTRCHLLGFQLTGEQDNSLNLLTGTKDMNQKHMAFYERQIAEYLQTTDHHVRYRVTPIFREQELVARGVEIEAQSIEDDTIHFNVYLFNVQDGVTIDYRTGELFEEEEVEV